MREREYELKFAVDPAALARLTSHPLLTGAGAPARAEHLVSTYFDTARSDLRRHRISLRVRTGEGTTTQTLKRARTSLVDRDEWEAPGGTVPDVAWLRTTPLAALFTDEAVSGGMDRRFTVDVERTVLPIDFADTRIEGAIDRGTIRAGDATLPVHELELEHKGGPREGIVKLVRQLARDLPLVLSLSGKAERGYAVADRSWGRPTKEMPIDLTEARRLETLFTAVLQGCLHALCRNATLIGGANDGDAVHKTRIALRHVRAAFALFEPVLRRKTLARIKREVKWMSDRLGAARDGDVFHSLVDDLGANGTATAPALNAALDPHRRRAHARLVSALASARWRLLLIDLLAFSIDGIRRSRRPTIAAPFVRRRVRRLRLRLGRDARGMVRTRPDVLHDLRKRAKMLRYDLDLIGDLPDLGIKRRHLRRTGSDLQAMQEMLGSIHDGEALAARLDEAVISRTAAPKGIDREAWPAVVAAARAVATRPADAGTLRKAANAAKHLRKRAF